MITCTLAVLGLFIMQTLLPPSIRYLSGAESVWRRLRVALGPRDEQPPLSRLGGRAQRALDNMHEALPVFLTLAILHLLHGRSLPLAERGAAVFLVARVVYVPVYMAGTAGLRSIVWLLSWVGLAMMIAALTS